MSEKLEAIIQKYKDNWDEQAKQLSLLVDVHRDHSSKFWRVVEAEMSGYQIHAQWLSQNGAEMTL